MTPCIYVMAPFDGAQKRRLQAAAGAMPMVFSDQCGAAGRQEAFAAAVAVIGEPQPGDLTDAPGLRWIQMTWAGADLYTRAQRLPDGLQISCATGVYGGTIAEYLFGAVLSMYCHLPRYVRQQAAEVWRPCFPGRGIEGSTVLLVGAGDIGTEFARRLRPFLPRRILGVRRTARETPPEFDEMYTMEDLPQLWGQADLVVCSLPHTRETAGLLDENALRAMKRDALLVNVGRGTLVSADVLAGVLSSGHLYGAVLDVCDPEPLPPEHPLWRMENVMLTPHIAGVGFGNVPETTERIVDLCCENLRRFLDGEKPRNLVDLSAGYRAL